MCYPSANEIKFYSYLTVMDDTKYSLVFVFGLSVASADGEVLTGVEDIGLW